jgi:apolipoprotein N-acyltransferase
MPARLLRAAAGVPEALFSSVLLILTVPPTNAHFLIWVAWVPLFLALERASSRRNAMLCGAVFCVLYHVLLFRWTLSMPVLVILFVVLSSAAYGIYFGAACRALRDRPRWLRAVLFPALWVAPAVVAGNPWHPFFDTVILLLGMHSSLPLPLLQLAHPLGEPGLAFFVVLVNALLAWAVAARGRAREAGVAFGCAAALLAGGWTWGAGQARKWTEAPASGEKPFRLACAQHDLPFPWEWRDSHQEEIYRTYDEMTASAAARGADMVLFPQYQIPEDIYRHPERWGEIARKSHVYMALGTYAPVVPEQYGAEAWVVSLVFGPDGRMIGTQRALHPSPFGRPMVVAGEDAEPIAIPSLGRLAILPCFDDVTPRPTRMFGRTGADFIAAIANDGLFKGTIHPRLHVIRSRLRAVESRRFLVHCTPNGISAVIDPAGRVLDSLPEGRGLLVHDFARGKIN